MWLPSGNGISFSGLSFSSIGATVLPAVSGMSGLVPVSYRKAARMARATDKRKNRGIGFMYFFMMILHSKLYLCEGKVRIVYFLLSLYAADVAYMTRKFRHTLVLQDAPEFSGFFIHFVMPFRLLSYIYRSSLRGSVLLSEYDSEVFLH